MKEGPRGDLHGTGDVAMQQKPHYTSPIDCLLCPPRVDCGPDLMSASGPFFWPLIMRASFFCRAPAMPSRSRPQPPVAPPPASTQPLGPADYLRRVLTARVYDVAVESALEPARNLSRRLHNKVLLKREDQQPVFSFKLRGAYNKMAHLSAEQLARGVICASAGNHAQGVALGAHKLGARAVVVMPVTTPQLKVDAVRV